ncbi:MAG: hypothetical protein HOE90_02000 [Bacteriovoracaceae bacterium]|nr:hypothetical protein [Bacteriovoracaceae bacterium]
MKWVLVGILVFLNFEAFADKNVHPLNLTHNERRKLTQEMYKIQAKMNGILDGISRGKLNAIAENANFLSTEVLNNPNYYKYNKEFASYFTIFKTDAKLLAKAVKDKNESALHKYYFRLVYSCMRCHTRFAHYRFQDFKSYTPVNEEEKIKYKFPDDWR